MQRAPFRKVKIRPMGDCLPTGADAPPAANPGWSAPPPRDIGRLAVSPGMPSTAHDELLPAEERLRLDLHYDKRQARTRVARIIFRTLAFILIVAAAAAGFAYERQLLRPPPPPAPLGLDLRRQVLRIMDESVKAKQEGRYEDAIIAAADARRIDPSTPGALIIMGEAALNLRDQTRLEQFASESLALGDKSGDAKLLLALGRWIGRGAQKEQFGDSGELAVRLLQEASAEDLSNAHVHFFLGELLRYLGREREAHLHLLAGLHRLEPWHSSTILKAKQQLAGAEAAALGEPAEVADTEEAAASAALVALRQKPDSDPEREKMIDTLRSSFGARSSALLLADQAFSLGGAPALPRALAAASAVIPHNAWPAPAMPDMDSDASASGAPAPGQNPEPAPTPGGPAEILKMPES